MSGGRERIKTVYYGLKMSIMDMKCLREFS
jgi:hypothetical protein